MGKSSGGSGFFSGLVIGAVAGLSLIHISEPPSIGMI